VVSLNDDGLPRLRVSNSYRRLLADAEGAADAKSYIREKLSAAQWLIRSIHQRQSTLSKVTNSIVRFQSEFFDHGVKALRPLVLEGSKLPDALAGEVARWSATSGLAAEVKTTGDVRALHPEVEVTLLRVAQEALANVAKHAGASQVWITLSYMEDVVTLDVRDDGAGFAVADGGSAGPGLPGESHAGGGFGLLAMRQRVGRLAGQLEIESEPGAGAAVSASLPAIGLGESS